MQLDVAKNGGKVKQYISLDSISSHQMLSYDGYILDKPQSRETSPEL